MGRWVDVAAADALPAGEAMRVDAGGWPVALVHCDGGLRAVENTCPHMGGPMGEGYVDGTTLICPWHAWRFDATTGCALANPQVRLHTYPVRVERGRIQVEVPD